MSRGDSGGVISLSRGSSSPCSTHLSARVLPETPSTFHLGIKRFPVTSTDIASNAALKAPASILERYPFLACPMCICALRVEDSGLVCPQCRTPFQIRAGTPIVLPEDASFDAAVAHDVVQREKGWARRVLNYGKHFGLKNHDRVLALCEGGPVLNLG